MAPARATNLNAKLRCKGGRGGKKAMGQTIDGNLFTKFRMCAMVFSLGDAPGPVRVSEDEERKR
jgi:hypothetical protein